MNVAMGGTAMLLWAQRPEVDEIPWLRWILVIAVVFFGIFPGFVAYMVLAERKIAGRFQDRIGPNRVGPFGLLQPIADAIKLVTKEDIVPLAADRWVHLLAPILIVVSSFLVLPVIPFGVGLAAVNPPSGLIYLIAVSSISALGVFLAGWSSRNKYSLLGAMRAVAQLVSYEVPQVLATVPVILWTGSLSLVDIFHKQVDYGWFVFSPPGFLAFVTLTIANIAEVNRTPFDLPEAESEIIAGYHTEYSGMRFGLFFIAEYLSVFAVSCLGTAIFLGGGTLPWPLTGEPVVTFGATETFAGMIFLNLPLIGIFMLKVSLYIFLMFWIRATLPRLRVDQLMSFAWKCLVPLSIVNIFIAAVWHEFVIRPAQPNYLLGWGITAPLVVGTVAAVFAIFRASAKSGEAGRPAPRRRVLVAGSARI